MLEKVYVVSHTGHGHQTNLLKQHYVVFRLVSKVLSKVISDEYYSRCNLSSFIVAITTL